MHKHFLDIQHKYFIDIEKGIKNFEIRRTNRDYKVGDYLILKSLKSKKTITKKISYINDISIYNIKNILILQFK